MRSFAGTTTAEQSSAANRRQPIRQARTNPTRTSAQAIFSATPGGDAPDATTQESPGFFPAITHFTDATTALPKEMIRHYQMLKEVDAKLHGPEEKLGQLLSAGLRAPVPKSSDVATDVEPLPDPSSPQFRHTRFARRTQFLEMRHELIGLLQSLDEKNHVMSTAIDCLNKQLKRCQSSFPFIEEEISEEARLGSMTHWAYNTEKSTEKKGMIGGERSRRAANNLAVETEAAAMRSEARREAVAARKGKHPNVDSDFDDAKHAGKKGHNGGKGKKGGDSVQGLGISNVGPPNKRRRVDQTGIGGVAMGRSVSSAFGAGARGASPAVDSKKKARGGVATTNGRRRQASSSNKALLRLTCDSRGGTNASGINSPNLASSPIIGTFTTSKDRPGRSPAPSMLPRVPSSRARQTGAQNAQTSRNRSSSTMNQRATNGNGLHKASVDIEKVSGLTGKSTGDVRNNMKETVNARGENMIEDTLGGDGAADMRGALVVDGSREHSNNGSRTRDRPPSISVRGGANSKNPSKNATPLATSFNAETSRSRPPRNADGPTKRSHKKGAGLAAQRAVAAMQANVDEDGASVQGNEEGEEGEFDEDNEPRYCYCNDFSYGEMVGCDADDCQKEWFHLTCVGLSKAPAKNAKWYCDDCKERLRKR